uniref:Metallothionein n=1 Tax=Oncorhynchus kisutch TaxID=8019 RepID=A0A8C7DNP7_ONCKI
MPSGLLYSSHKSCWKTSHGQLSVLISSIIPPGCCSCCPTGCSKCASGCVCKEGKTCDTSCCQ